MNNIILSKRLLHISSLVRQDTVLIDVGTDHAYLPIYLVSEGRIKRAIASDVAEGPLQKARGNIEKNGMCDRIEAVLSDGTLNTDVAAPCDIVIAGMGGELIAKIIDADPRLKNGEISLILQPMTKAEHLRRYLSENGFFINREALVSDGKLYQIISCSYVGEPYTLDESELVLGKKEARSRDELFLKLVCERLETVRTVYNGKMSAGANAEYEKRLINVLEELL